MLFWNSLVFFHDPTDLGNLISGSSAFSKSSLYIWKLSVHILLKSSLKDFEHNFDSMLNKCNCILTWTFFCSTSLGLKWKLIFSSLVANFWVFQIFWHIECSTFTAPSSRIWNSSTGIPSPPLVLFIVMLPKDDLTLQSRISGLGEWLPIFLLLGANQNHKEVSSDTGQNGQHQNVYNKKCWQGCVEKRTLAQCF